MFKVGDVVKFRSQYLVYEDGSVLRPKSIIGKCGLITQRIGGFGEYGHFMVKVMGGQVVSVHDADKSLREVRNKTKAFNIKLELS